MAKEMSRRTFLKQGAAAAIGLAVVPSTVLGKKFGYTAPSDKLNILGVGVGGRGASVLKGLESQNIIGLCDVDWKYADHIFKRYPAAKKFNDYRKMYDEMLKSADAVMVATADHTHAIIAADAITAGKHVYCEKPLTHTVYESRLLTKLADKYKVATQMGNQGASAEGVRKVCEWIWNGEIGEVRRVDTFTDRPIWPQGLARPEEDMRIPKTMNWDAFIGPAPYRPYNAAYTPWNFRGWWDFGTGALGDMACHILHPVFKGLKLGYPTKVEGSSTLLLNESAPSAQRVKFIFPARDNMPKVAMPEVEVHWYDGGLMPERPAGLPAGKNLNVSGGAAIFYGTKDTLICGCYGKDKAPSRWTVEDGAIKFNGSGGGEAQTGEGGDLIFAKKFKNFELEMEWKVSKGGNSGIFYLAQEVTTQKDGKTKYEPIYISCPEYQVLDNTNHPDAKLGVDGNRQSASLYDMIPAVPQNQNPFGEWNKAKIMVYKGTVVHGQNDKNVVEYHLWTPQWTEMLENSKFSSEKWPLAFELLNNCGGENHEGYIGLQDHGDDVWFRNIRVKILD